jgi:hypothetical protein
MCIFIVITSFTFFTLNGTYLGTCSMSRAFFHSLLKVSAVTKRKVQKLLEMYCTVHKGKTMTTWGWANFDPSPGFYLNKLDRHPLEDVSCWKTKLYLFVFLSLHFIQIRKINDPNLAGSILTPGLFFEQTW